MEKKKKKQPTRTKQIKIRSGRMAATTSTTMPVETNNILAKLSQHLQISIFLQRAAEVSGAYEQLQPHSGCEH